MQEITISVIIPCFNSSLTIIQAIESVLNQTFRVLEIIVVDDGSTDDTRRLVSTFIEGGNHKDSIQLVLQSNAGPSAARNHGIRKAKGEWIAFLDADDSWHPSKLEYQVEILNRLPDLVLLGETVYNSKLKFRKVFLKSLIFRNHFRTSSVIIKKNVIERFLFDEKMKYSEDYRLWLLVTSEYATAATSSRLVKEQHVMHVKRARLSTKLDLMEKGELSNYRYLLTLKKIRLFDFYAASAWSLLKFVLRKLKLK